MENGIKIWIWGKYLIKVIKVLINEDFWVHKIGLWDLDSTQNWPKLDPFHIQADYVSLESR